MKNWSQIYENVPVDTASYWTNQVVDYCNGRLFDSGAGFVKQDNVKQHVVLKEIINAKEDVKEVKVEQAQQVVLPTKKTQGRTKIPLEVGEEEREDSKESTKNEKRKQSTEQVPHGEHL